MKRQSELLEFSVKKASALACGAVLLSAMGFASLAGAQDSPAPGPDLDKRPGECPKAQAEDGPQARRPRMEGERQAYRRGGDEGFGRRDGRPGPARSDEFGRGPNGYGPPARSEDGERGYRQGPPRRRGELGEGPEGFGPPSQRDRGDRGYRQGPPPGPEAGEDGFRQGPPPQGFRGQRGPDGVEGPRGPMGPPSFADLDSDGDGAISKAEFDAFHAKRMENRPPRPRDGRRPAPPLSGDMPAPGGAVALPAPPRPAGPACRISPFWPRP